MMPIDNISEWAFQGLPELHKLVMQGCQLTEPPPIAPIVRTLRYLGLAANNLTYIPPEYFTGCNLLDTISLAGNRFSVVPDVRNLNTTLKRFILDDNIITSIESLYFVPMIKLKTFVLARNLLTEIKFDNTIWPIITYMSLDNNFLTSIKTSGLSRVWGKVMINVWGNPWHCDEKLCWLSRCHNKMGRIRGIWFGCRGSEMIKLTGEIVCNSPSERRNVAINGSGKQSYVPRYTVERCDRTGQPFLWPLLLTWFDCIISAWISNYIHYKVWDEITYPFLNFNGCTVEV